MLGLPAETQNLARDITTEVATYKDYVEMYIVFYKLMVYIYSKCYYFISPFYQ